MNRAAMMDRLASRDELWDMLIVGGGATGLGCAVDAAARGYRVALVERGDFGQGTSSRSTKLIHGGVRYLRQGRIGLVMESLGERARLMTLAPHLVRDQPFVVPVHRPGGVLFYGLGLRLYDLLAGRNRLGWSRPLSAAQTRSLLPTLRSDRLRGSVLYHDGLFDDARLLVALAQTAAAQGACLANYVEVEQWIDGPERRLAGAVARDRETGQALAIRARVVVNATGPFSDRLRRVDNPAARPLIAPSQGAHLVLPRSFLPGDSALLIPRTRDGRVLFAIPWHDHIVVGTTETPLDEPDPDPRPRPNEIAFLLETLAHYLTRPASAADLRSIFAGVRPLVRSGSSRNTARLARDHLVEVSPSGLVSVLGGKWTTYRRMAEDAVNRAAVVAGLPRRPCVTGSLPIHGHEGPSIGSDHWAVYGSDALALRELAGSQPELAQRLHPELPYRAAEVVWAARNEMARTVEDVLCRRTRAAFLNARAALAIAPQVAALMATVLGRDATWIDQQRTSFTQAIQAYLPPEA
ncbi:MAG: glycerol-3-phosphate dehydrogenase [Isosphaeraceae bacterium]|jgi:glycerol-3-phosphate dehydrogenase|nr:MAG: glycerol-3-phosphate dehydrogenase [Isosphaeraceae bacterium]